MYVYPYVYIYIYLHCHVWHLDGTAYFLILFLIWLSVGEERKLDQWWEQFMSRLRWPHAIWTNPLWWLKKTWLPSWKKWQTDINKSKLLVHDPGSVQLTVKLVTVPSGNDWASSLLKPWTSRKSEFSHKWWFSIVMQTVTRGSNAHEITSQSPLNHQYHKNMWPFSYGFLDDFLWFFHFHLVFLWFTRG